MLVLSRQRDETIMIGDEIEITVVDIRGDKVRLGINAPTRIAVHRKEIYDAIRAENQRAAEISGNDLATVKSAFAGSKPVPGRPALTQAPAPMKARIAGNLVAPAPLPMRSEKTA